MFMSDAIPAKAERDAINRSLAVIHFYPDGTIAEANENFLNVMGYSLGEVKGKHHSMFVDPVYAHSQEYREFWEKLARGEYQAAQFQRFGKGGKEIWIEASYNPILNKAGKVIQVVKYATDITAQKLRNADYVGQIEAISKSQAVIHFNMDGTIITANQNFLNAVGYSLEEIEGKHHSIFVEPEYAASQEYRNLWAKLNYGQFEAGQFNRLGKNGKEIWIEASYNPILDMNNKPFKVVKYATDITAQKLKNADYIGQIEAIGKSQAVIHFNMDGTIIAANQNFLSVMGYSLEEIKGKHHSMFAKAEYARSQEYKDFWEKLNRGEYQAGEYKRLGKNGKEVWIMASYNPILDMNNKPFKVVKYATDITAQMKARLESVELTATMHSVTQAVAAAAEEMSCSIAEINKSMADSAKAVDDIAGKIEQADELMISLRKTAGSMEAVVELIRRISNQVNLLALNATIEASRAGDAGQGFSVVALEIKNLASQTAKAISDIAEKITALQELSTHAAESSTAINQATSLVSSSVNIVVSAIKEQSIVTREISHNMHKASQSVEDLNKCIRNIADASYH